MWGTQALAVAVPPILPLFTQQRLNELCGTQAYPIGWLGAKRKQTTTRVVVMGAKKKLQLVEITEVWIDARYFKMEVTLYFSEHTTNQYGCFSTVVRMLVISLTLLSMGVHGSIPVLSELF